MGPAETDKVVVLEQKVRTLGQFDDVMHRKVIVCKHAPRQTYGAEIMALLPDLGRLPLPGVGIPALFLRPSCIAAARTPAAVLVAVGYPPAVRA